MFFEKGKKTDCCLATPKKIARCSLMFKFILQFCLKWSLFLLSFLYQFNSKRSEPLFLVHNFHLPFCKCTFVIDNKGPVSLHFIQQFGSYPQDSFQSLPNSLLFAWFEMLSFISYRLSTFTCPQKKRKVQKKNT